MAATVATTARVATIDRVTTVRVTTAAAVEVVTATVAMVTARVATRKALGAPRKVDPPGTKAAGAETAAIKATATTGTSGETRDRTRDGVETKVITMETGAIKAAGEDSMASQDNQDSQTGEAMATTANRHCYGGYGCVLKLFRWEKNNCFLF